MSTGSSTGSLQGTGARISKIALKNETYHNLAYIHVLFVCILQKITLFSYRCHILWIYAHCTHISHVCMYLYNVQMYEQ
jgi:hypothetical protein